MATKNTTGQTCQKSGIYKGGKTQKVEIAISQGEKFPPIRGQKTAVDWKIVRPTKN